MLYHFSQVFRAVTRRCCMSDAFEETKILTAIPMRSTSALGTIRAMPRRFCYMLSSHLRTILHTSDADIAALATRAAMHAVRDLISAFEGGKNNSFETPTADDIVLETRHFERALDGASSLCTSLPRLYVPSLFSHALLPLPTGFHPSLTAAQLLSYEKLRQSFSS